MFKFFRNIRKKLLQKGENLKYIKYAIGEITLVVIGILIAIQINDWNRESVLLTEEKEAIKNILTDLKRDSTLLNRYNNGYKTYLNTFFDLNNIKNKGGYLKNITSDFIVSNLEFNPAVQKNNLPFIEKLRDKKIRTQINHYFRLLSQVEYATSEYNKLIAERSRPFFLEEINIFKNSEVFDYQDRTFPPFKRVSVVDTVSLKKAIAHKKFIPILSQLRMSIGFYLTVLELSILENKKLINELEKLSD